jgi:hypothetical protein
VGSRWWVDVKGLAAKNAMCVEGLVDGMAAILSS